MTETIVAQRLKVLAGDYDREATRHYTPEAKSSILSAAATLRLVAVLVNEGTYTDTYGYVWLRAGRAVLRNTYLERISA